MSYSVQCSVLTALIIRVGFNIIFAELNKVHSLLSLAAGYIDSFGERNRDIPYAMSICIHLK